MFRALYDAVIGFVSAHQSWAALVVLLLAFGESLAFISVLIPGTTVLFGIGGLIGVAGLPFWPLWAAAVAGAIAGDYGSYWLGRCLERKVATMWPISRSPGTLAGAEAVFRRWGIPGVVIGRLCGPLRGTIALVAGICGMRHWVFLSADIAAALVWATGVLAPGAAAMRWLLS